MTNCPVDLQRQIGLDGTHLHGVAGQVDRHVPAGDALGVQNDVVVGDQTRGVDARTGDGNGPALRRPGIRAANVDVDGE
jgi:hypothetical protein